MISGGKLAAMRSKILTFSSKSFPKSATYDELNCEEEAATEATKVATRTLKGTLNFMVPSSIGEQANYYTGSLLDCLLVMQNAPHLFSS